ncbi:hypothetical protein DRQ12_05040 [candidate division KSB1 bacterium]|nr:MAG: hypothetical protein DRQ12_05040 [candidate division KSB1 bacterium]
MRNLSKSWRIFLLFLLLPATLWGQNVASRYGMGMYGSAVKMVLGSTDHSTIDQWAGVSVLYGFSPNFLMELRGAYGWVYPRNPHGSQFKGVGHHRTLLMPFCLDWVFLPLPEKEFRPFFVGGGGVLHWDLRDITGTTSMWDNGESVRSQTNATVVLGFGLEYVIADRLSVLLFTRYHHLFKGNEDTIGTSPDYDNGRGDDNRGVVEVGLGLRLFSTSHRDTDGDGIEDRFDADPKNPEDFDEFEDWDGKPDLDNDRDGIPDVHDKAPNLAEDLDGFMDEDGVPDLDNDNDGIPDTEDKCPNEAEDFDGFQDKDGCPDLDNDGDGIQDSLDKCPNEPETFNNYQDEDGCPDKKPVIEKGKKLILRGINFESGSAQLTPDSYAVLDTVYESLAANPEVVVEIRGHTDSVGDWNYNLKLSQKRAEVVKQYLVNCGIDPSRIRAVGYGEKDPIASNATAKGRALNRRIEFVRIK